MIFEPIHIEKYNIYDVFYSPLNYFMLSVANIIRPQVNIKIFHNEEWKNFTMLICSHKKTCNYYFHAEYKEKIKLKINDKDEYEINVIKYPLLSNNATVMSTMVQNEDNYMKQWIEYHSKLGVHNFIIYDNAKVDDKISHCSKETKSNLKELLKDYIEEGRVILIKWPYPKVVSLNKKIEIEIGNERTNIRDIDTIPISHISGQSTQQTHSIHAFRNVKYIGLFDIDEYINPINNYNINSILNIFFTNHKNFGGVEIKCKFFYNPNNLDEEGYNFMKIENCGKVIQRQNIKTFVKPRNVESFSIHKIAIGRKVKPISENIVYFNHYFFLNKLNRGKTKTKFTDKSILDKLKYFKINID
jgi:hypothetical protein